MMTFKVQHQISFYKKMDYIQIGFLGKTHGLKGELKLKIDELFIDDFEEAEVIFVKIKGQYTPLFVESIRASDNPIIKFEETDTKEAAATYQHQPFFLRASDVTVLIEEEVLELVYQYCEGFTVIDDELGKLGTIEAIESYPHQEMALIKYRKKSVLIPLNQYIITNIDEANKIVYVALPEGLLDM